MKVSGGKAIYGASVGILMLEAQFPRIPGDMGNALTWPFPVHYRVIKGAAPDLVVRQGAPALLNKFIEAGQELVAMGVRGITTNCGFLGVFQSRLQDALNVPVAASSLMQVAMVRAILPAHQHVGILTISAETLTHEHLSASNVPMDTPIEGTDSGVEFTDAILGNRLTLDIDASRRDLIEAARRLQHRTPNLGAIVLECTNMCPYATDIAEDTGLPVYSIYDFVCWFQSGLSPRRFSPALHP